MGLLTFALNVTLDGCCDHREGIADDELHHYFTGLMDAAGATLFQGLERSRRLELVSTTRLKSGVMALHYLRKE
jgi:hypothetical protein